MYKVDDSVERLYVHAWARDNRGMQQEI